MGSVCGMVCTSFSAFTSSSSYLELFVLASRWNVVTWHSGKFLILGTWRARLVDSPSMSCCSSTCAQQPSLRVESPIPVPMSPGMVTRCSAIALEAGRNKNADEFLSHGNLMVCSRPMSSEVVIRGRTNWPGVRLGESS